MHRDLRQLARTGVFFSGLIWLSTGGLTAQNDARGSQDHPLFPSRMPGFYISSYQHVAFDSHTFRLKPSPAQVEGKKTVIIYTAPSGAPRPSALEVLRNYQNATREVGGEVLSDDGTTTILRLQQGGQEVWVELRSPNPAIRYFLTVVERGGMEQVIKADAILKELNQAGFMAIDVRFDSGRAELRPESQPVIDEVVALLNAHPELKLSIEGHTDNVGNPASNQELSQQRAEAVRQALVSGGIDAAARLEAAGYGQERPVADNRTEEGRAKNRRVELVKK